MMITILPQQFPHRNCLTTNPQERRARRAVPRLRPGARAGGVGLRPGGCHGVFRGRWGMRMAKNTGKTMEKNIDS